MADFVHCNKCFKRPSADFSLFCITSCFHVLCKPCSEKSVEAKKCVICSTDNVRVVDINREMDKRLQWLFKNPRDFLTERFQFLKRKFDFQATCYASIISHLKNVKTENAQLKEAVAEQGEKCKTLEEEKQALTQQLRELEEKLAEMAVKDNNGNDNALDELASPFPEKIQGPDDSDYMQEFFRGTAPNVSRAESFGFEQAFDRTVQHQKKKTVGKNGELFPSEASTPVRNFFNAEPSLNTSPGTDFSFGVVSRDSSGTSSRMLGIPRVRKTPSNPYVEAIFNRNANRSGGNRGQPSTKTTTPGASRSLNLTNTNSNPFQNISQQNNSSLLIDRSRSRSPGIRITRGHLIPRTNTPNFHSTSTP